MQQICEQTTMLRKNVVPLQKTNEITPTGTDNSCFLPMKKSTFLQILGFVAVSILFLLPTNAYAQNNNLTVVDGKGTYYTPR